MPQKKAKMLEDKPKKHLFVSHGDFQQYLYEVSIFPIPSP